ncbi:DNA polymerase I [Mycobacterium phage Quesadilla]|uniref:DNA polymerase I n=1 Tax=Mycobacterium phage Quesadilla TaxID=2664226 RepID=A0A5Q2W9X6_9CAUD|nr:DNA polymerase I [Mycobacterium phage Quesadilla]QGH75306.1 DNA polymerase I [Mycobacterium phage Quesadilla]
MTTVEAIPRVPSRRWHDPVLGASLSTGAEAERAVGAMPHNLAVAIDIETPGLDRNFTINCVTAAWDDGRGVQAVLLDPARTAGHAALVEEINAKAGKLILHNAAFDVPPLYHAGLLSKAMIDKIADTVLLARYALPEPPPYGQGKKLEQLVTKFLGWTDSKGGMERAFKAAGYRTIQAGFEGMDIDSPIYRFGAMADTVATLALEPVMRQMAIDWSLDHPFVNTYSAASTPAEAEALIATQETVHQVMLRRSAVGLNVDRAYLTRYQEQVDIERNLAIAELAVHGLEGGAGKGAKLIEYLAERGELPEPWPRTPTRKLRATKADLEGLDHPLAHAQRKLAVIDKVMGYLEKVERQSAVTGRCHPQVAVLGASATGRMSYGSPELQQFPKEARAIICDDGQGLTSIDWSQIEPVTMANMARDEAFLAPYEAGLDLYGPIERSCGCDRDTAKVVLLSTMYGSGIAKLAATIGHTEESAAQIRRQMFEAMKKCERWMFRVQDVAEASGRTITVGGRILPVDPGGVFKAVNYTVQGSAYDVLAHTIVTMEEAGLGDHLQLAMHDEVVVDTEVADEVREIMSTPPPFLVEWSQRQPVLRTDRADMGHAWAKV